MDEQNDECRRGITIIGRDRWYELGPQRERRHTKIRFLPNGGRMTLSMTPQHRNRQNVVNPYESIIELRRADT